jgi:hypothetical protein
MPLPAIGAAVPWLIGAGKGALGMAVKGGSAKLAGAAAGGAFKANAASKLASAVAAAKGLGTASGAKNAAVGGTRMAGNALGKIWEMSGRNTGERLMRLGPDALFGTMAAVNTPGDLGDKLIAGGTQAIGSVGLGLGASKLPGIRGTAMEGPMDMVGSIAGDFAGMYGGDALLRAKGGGTTPWEKVQMEGNEQMRQELERQILSQYGLAGYRPTDLLG